ncbi:MAG: hypothetical protein ACK5B9_03000 [Flavobacteriia bacterium]|jgi:hypothetical protein
MELNKAKELAAFHLDKANIVVVTSDNAVYLLNDKAEISVIEDHAKRNKLACFVVKGAEVSAEVAEVVAEEKPKKKK